jgi:hypothetical protein
MTEFRADLHCHTTCSDGSSTPEEVLKYAQELGLRGLSVTDHDTIDAYAVLVPEAQRLGIQLISGVEFSTVHEGESIHVLAYSFALDDPHIAGLCRYHAERRQARNRQMLNLLADHGMPLEESETLSLGRTVGRPHIAWAMINRGYVKSIEEAFKKYLGDGCPCYVQGVSISTQETIDVIHKANGYAIIAHPHLIKNQRTILKLIGMDFDGIEAYYAKFLPHAEKQWVKIGQRKNWLITGGSDYHGLGKPNIPLGCSWVGEDLFNILLSRYQKNTK